MTNETNAATTPSVTSILSMLDAYQDCHAIANDALKKSLWNLYKARRNRQVNSLTVCDNLHFTAQTVRTEFEPQLMLVTTTLAVDNNNGDDMPAELADEATSSKGKPKSKDSTQNWNGQFVLVDRAKHFEQQQKKQKELEKENQQSDAAADTAPTTVDKEDTGTMGLRQRKKGDKKKTKTDDDTSAAASQWTKEDVVAPNASDSTEQQTEAMLNHGDDPLQLLGGASQPHELAVAREEARKALDEYIQAANLLRAIQTATATQKSVRKLIQELDILTMDGNHGTEK